MQSFFHTSPYYLRVAGSKWLFNIKYKDSLKELKEIYTVSQYEESQFNMWLLNRLASIVDYAFLHVPFYHQVYSEAGYRLGEIRSVSDFESLPMIDKDMVKNNHALFLSDEVDTIPHQIKHTGGSTDLPLEFRIDTETFYRSRAHFLFYWEMNGYVQGRDRCVRLRGDHILNKNTERLYIYDNLLNYKSFDSAYITEKEYTAAYKKQMEDFHARFLQTYPSSAYNLAKMFEAAGMIAPQFETIFFASENTIPEQTAYIKRIFGAHRIAYHYGQSENVALAVKHMDCDSMGFLQTFGYGELVEKTGKSVKQAGSIGQILGTSYNKSMPLIRYCTGDYAIKSDYQPNDWMRNCLSIERVEGRNHEFIVTKDGRLLSPLTISVDDTIPSLKQIGEMQYYQDTPGIITIRVTALPGKEITDSIVEGIRKDYYHLLRDKLDVNVEQVDKIKKTAINKRILVEQKLDISAYRG